VGPLVAASVGLTGSVALTTVGAFLVLKQPQTNSLFVEDRMGYAVAKVSLGTVVVVIGVVGFCQSLGALLHS
jgi:hypothetical protein